jgi:hypothetical protein
VVVSAIGGGNQNTWRKPSTTKNTGKYDSIGDKKEKKHVHT